MARDGHGGAPPTIPHPYGQHGCCPRPCAQGPFTSPCVSKRACQIKHGRALSAHPAPPRAGCFVSCARRLVGHGHCHGPGRGGALSGTGIRPRAGAISHRSSTVCMHLTHTAQAPAARHAADHGAGRTWGRRRRVSLTHDGAIIRMTACQHYAYASYPYGTAQHRPTLWQGRQKGWFDGGTVM